MKTYRRDKLRRLAEAGKLIAIGTYSFDDMYGESRTADAMPVKMIHADRSECRNGTCYVFPNDFESGSGRAWLNPNGTVTLYVHSNSNYTFRILDTAQ